MKNVTDTPQAAAAEDEAAVDRSAALVLHQLVFSRASDLARLGAYELAEQLLRRLMAVEASADALDLLARIRAQQGRLVEAQSLWTRVLRIVPEHGPAERALERIRLVERHRQARDNPGLSIEVPGATTAKEGRTMAVRFDFPLFAATTAAGVALNARAREVVADVGKQIRPYQDCLTIEVLGYPDCAGQSGPPRSGGACLGMARASVIFDQLVRAAGIREDVFQLRALDRPPAVHREKSLAKGVVPGAEIRLSQRKV